MVASLVKPFLDVGLADLKLELDDTQWKAVEEHLDLAKASLDAAADLTADAAALPGHDADVAPAAMAPTEADDTVIAQLHSMLHQQDPHRTRLGLVRVVSPIDGRFLWIHPQFTTANYGTPPQIPQPLPQGEVR